MEKLLKDEKDNLKKVVNKYEKHCEMIDGQMKQHELHQNERESKITLLQERLLQIGDRDKELERIFDYILDLTRSNFVYQPVDNDKIDKQLADIIFRN